MILAWALDFALLAFSLAVLLSLWRLLRGPHATDRVLALDTLSINAVALAILMGMRLGTVLLFEAALIIAMLGFVGTVALGRFLARGDVVE
jgi:multicomponent K+:H+ antiporter subunit F